MRVLVTGASGGFGVATVERLLRAGHEVVGLSRSGRASGQTGHEYARLEYRAADIRDGDTLHALHDRCRAVATVWVGAALLEWALGEARERACDAVQLSVFSENHGAQRFYARYGFDKVGEYLFQVGATRDLEFILRRPAG